MSVNYDFIAIFLIYGGFEDTKTRILGAWSWFYLTKTEKDLKVLFLRKNADIRIINLVLVLKSIFSETAHLYVLTYQISSI